MSMMLRKATQDLLDSVGLQNFHCGVDSHNFLTIENECGKPAATIHGMQFSRSIPSKNEIEYVVDMLDPILLKYVKDIKDLSKHRENVKKLEDNLHRYLESENINFQDYRYRLSILPKVNKPSKGIHTFKLVTFGDYTKFKAVHSDISYDQEAYISSIDESRVTQKEVNRCITALEHGYVLCQKMIVAQKAVDNLQQKLNSCSI